MLTAARRLTVVLLTVVAFAFGVPAIANADPGAPQYCTQFVPVGQFTHQACVTKLPGTILFEHYVRWTGGGSSTVSQWVNWVIGGSTQTCRSSTDTYTSGQQKYFSCSQTRVSGQTYKSEGYVAGSKTSSQTITG